MQTQTYTVLEMNAASSIGQIARNLETGSSTQWDADYLQGVGIPLDDDQQFRIAHGLTTVDDVEPLWDAAFYSGVI